MTRVELHELRFRRDRGEWLMGRVDTGDVVAVPEAGMRAVLLLREGLSVEETRQRLLAESSVRLDVAGFVTGLAAANLVRAIDGRPTGSSPPRPATLARIRPEHVRWTLSPVLHVVLGLVVLAAAIAVLREPRLLPAWHDLLWTPHGSLILLGQVTAGWTLILLHELAHLVTARAAGVPGRITLGTRLQFLAAQTDVSGIWLSGRRHRLTVYLSGMAMDVTIASLCLLTSAALGTRHPALSLIVLTVLTMTSAQFLIFMRTDVYFVLQDLTGCRNLYGDALTHLRHLLPHHPPPARERTAPPARERGALPARGRAALPARERTVSPARERTALPADERVGLRVYAFLLVAGTAVCLGVACTVTFPTLVALLAGAVHRLGTPLGALDGLTVITIVLGTQALWARAWWRRHGPKLRRRDRITTAS